MASSAGFFRPTTPVRECASPSHLLYPSTSTLTPQAGRSSQPALSITASFSHPTVSQLRQTPLPHLMVGVVDDTTASSLPVSRTQTLFPESSGTQSKLPKVKPEPQNSPSGGPVLRSNEPPILHAVFGPPTSVFSVPKHRAAQSPGSSNATTVMAFGCRGAGAPGGTPYDLDRYPSPTPDTVTPIATTATSPDAGIRQPPALIAQGAAPTTVSPPLTGFRRDPQATAVAQLVPTTAPVRLKKRGFGLKRCTRPEGHHVTHFSGHSPPACVSTSVATSPPQPTKTLHHDVSKRPVLAASNDTATSIGVTDGSSSLPGPTLLGQLGSASTSATTAPMYLSSSGVSPPTTPFEYSKTPEARSPSRTARENSPDRSGEPVSHKKRVVKKKPHEQQRKHETSSIDDQQWGVLASEIARLLLNDKRFTFLGVPELATETPPPVVTPPSRSHEVAQPAVSRPLRLLGKGERSLGSEDVADHCPASKLLERHCKAQKSKGTEKLTPTSTFSPSSVTRRRSHRTSVTPFSLFTRSTAIRDENRRLRKECEQLRLQLLRAQSDIDRHRCRCAVAETALDRTLLVLAHVLQRAGYRSSFIIKLLNRLDALRPVPLTAKPFTEDLLEKLIAPGCVSENEAPKRLPRRQCPSNSKKPKDPLNIMPTLGPLLMTELRVPDVEYDMQDMMSDPAEPLETSSVYGQQQPTFHVKEKWDNLTKASGGSNTGDDVPHHISAILKTEEHLDVPLSWTASSVATKAEKPYGGPGPTRHQSVGSSAGLVSLSSSCQQFFDQMREEAAKEEQHHGALTLNGENPFLLSPKSPTVVIHKPPGNHHSPEDHKNCLVDSTNQKNTATHDISKTEENQESRKLSPSATSDAPPPQQPPPVIASTTSLESTEDDDESGTCFCRLETRATTLPCKPRPRLVPPLGLEGVGAGSWLSGQQTLGETYSSYSPVGHREDGQTKTSEPVRLQSSASPPLA